MKVSIEEVILLPLNLLGSKLLHGSKCTSKNYFEQKFLESKFYFHGSEKNFHGSKIQVKLLHGSK